MGTQRYRACLPMKEVQLRSLGQEDPLEKEMSTHSSILAWEIPWREEPGKLQWGRKRVVTTDQLNSNNKDTVLYCFTEGEGMRVLGGLW